MRAYKLIFLRQITFNKQRFFSIFSIIALGVAFYAGLRTTSPSMKMTADSYFNEQNMMDYHIIAPLGFTSEDIIALEQIGEISVMPSFKTEAVISLENASLIINVHSMDVSLGKEDVNQPKLIEGRMPKAINECLLDRKIAYREDFKIGNTINLENHSVHLKTNTYTIVGYVDSPLYISIDRGYTLGGELNGFILIDKEAFLSSYYTNLFITFKDPHLSRFSKQYEEKIVLIKQEIDKVGKDRIEKRLDELNNQNIAVTVPPNWVILDLFQNAGFNSYRDDANRIAAVGNVFPLIFFLVSALVSLTSMTRMVENDRTEIGTILSLGYSRFMIIKKYVLYALSASIAGGILGFFIGVHLFPQVIYNAYGILYQLKPLEINYSLYLAITSILAAVLAGAIPAYISSYQLLTIEPAILMRKKAPDPGKRIILEKIGFIWKQLKFTQKVAVRNLLRYKKRFFMTFIGIAGCTGLLLTGFGLRDSISSIINRQFHEIRNYDAEIYLNDTSDLDQLNQFIVNNEMITNHFYLNQESISIYYEELNKEVYLVVPDIEPSMDDFIQLRDRVTHEKIPLMDHSVIITEKLASLLEIEVGDYIEIVNKNYQRIEVKVSGIVENYVHHYIYMTIKTYENLFKKELQYNLLLAKVIRNDDESLKHLNQELMHQDEVKNVYFTHQIEMHFVRMIKALNDVVYVSIISAAILAFLVLFTLTNINIDERKRELATIKVLGFYDKEVSSYIYRENGILTFIGVSLGLIFGFFLHRFTIVTTETDIVMFSRKIHEKSYLYAVLLTFLFAFIVNWMMYYRVYKIDMIESLKNVE